MTPSEALAEARRRIAIARDCHIPWLDLGDLGLEEIPQEIGELSGLRRLALGRCELREESANSQWEWDRDRPWSSLTSVEQLRGLSGLATLDLAGCVQLTDVSVLAGLTTLTSLNLSRCEQLTDVSVLAGLTALTSLDLSWCEQLTDVSGLAGLPALTSLDLSVCRQLTDVSGLAGLPALTSLDLSWCEQLTDVSVLAGLPALTSLNLSWCEQLTDVSVLAGLTALTSLDLSWCEQLTDVSVLAGLTALTSLNLSWCEQLTDVSVLAGLTALTSLDLSWCEQLTDVSVLAGLTALTSLNLSRCKQLTDVSVLAGLTALTSLDLSWCEQLTDVSVLAGLTALTSLDLSGCKQLTDVSVLAGLPALTSLNLSRCKQLTDVSVLAGLTALTSLDLSVVRAAYGRLRVSRPDGTHLAQPEWCEQLTDVSVLAGLTALTSLNLSECEQLTDVSVLAGLPALTSLNLSWCRQLTDVSVLAGLTALTSLDLSVCKQLTDVSVLAGLTALTSLNLRWCEQLTDVSVLAGLTALTSLDLRGCVQLKAFAPIRPLLDHLTTLTLNGCLFNDLDPALCGGHDENVLHKVRAHFADAEFRAVDDAELKLFLLGNGGVGKTQLCRRLCGLDFDVSIDSTHGVEVNRFSLSLATQQTVHLNIWDFGGQDVYHGTHALFLQKHALYVILWRPEMEAGTVNDHGLVMRNRPLAYWLDFVRSVAGTEAPVLIVQSQFDDANAVPATIAAEHSDFLRARVVQASAKEDDGLERLSPELKRSVKYLLEKRPILSIGAGRVRVRDRLRKWLAADQAKPAKQQKYRTLSWKRFVKLCEKGDGDVSSPEALADFLHNTGFFIYDPKLFHGEIILDQGWALEAIYAVLHRDRSVTQLRQKRGRFTREDLGFWLWDRESHSIADQERFISMMIGCGICFRMRKLSDNGEWPEVWEYAAPDHLPTLAEFQRRYPNIELPDPQTARVAVKVDFRFLHDGLLRSLLVCLGEVGKSAADYWRYGCYFRHQESDIRIRFDSATTPDGPSAAGNITFSAWGEQGRELLERLLEEVQRLSPGQRVQPEWSSQEAGDTLRPGSAGLGPSAPDPRRRSRKAGLDSRVRHDRSARVNEDNGHGREVSESELCADCPELSSDLEGILDRAAARQSGPRQASSSEPPLPEPTRLINALSALTEGQLEAVASGLEIELADLPKRDKRSQAVEIHRRARLDGTGQRLQLLRKLIFNYNREAFN